MSTTHQGTYILLGACGYIAPRHLESIHATGGKLLAAMDPYDSAGRLDRHFPQARFFTRFEDLQLFVGDGGPPDYVVVCTPNHLHHVHAQWALYAGADVICEKPLALTSADAVKLTFAEGATNHRVNVIQQLRLHPAIAGLRGELRGGRHQVELRYSTPRGPWYQASWKGDANRSGGLLFNIGIHLFDILLHLFGPCDSCVTPYMGADVAGGTLRLERADVRWNLSIRNDRAPSRDMLVDGRPVDFTAGFDALHTESYWMILDGKGFRPADAIPAIKLIETIRERA